MKKRGAKLEISSNCFLQ